MYVGVADFVNATASRLEYKAFLNERPATSLNVKEFIHEELFLYYVGRAAAIVMFLLATMAIVELLQGNGCFDFLSEIWIRTRSSKRVLWTLTATTFVISANLDNLTTATMMLVLMHKVVQSRRQRMLIGSAIVIAANCGGSFTVIGDPTGLILWGRWCGNSQRVFLGLYRCCSARDFMRGIYRYFIGRSLHPAARDRVVCRALSWR